MKNVIFISFIMLFIINIFLGAIFSYFNIFNIVISSIIIVLTALLLYLINCIELKNAFKISLFIIFGIAGFLEYIIFMFLPFYVIDYWGSALIFIVLLAEGIKYIILLISHTISTKIE